MVSHPSCYLDNSGISLKRVAENECVAYILLVRVSFWPQENCHITSWPLASGDKHLIGPWAGVAKQKAENISHLGPSIKDNHMFTRIWIFFAHFWSHLCPWLLRFHLSLWLSRLHAKTNYPGSSNVNWNKFQSDIHCSQSWKHTKV